MPVREQHLQELLQSMLGQCSGSSALDLALLRESAHILEADAYNSAASCSEYMEKVKVHVETAGYVFEQVDGSGLFSQAVEAITAALLRLEGSIDMSSVAEGLAAPAASADGSTKRVISIVKRVFSQL
jgi:hypothetical protein